MVLRFDIAITETTQNFPMAVLFSLDMCQVKTQNKHNTFGSFPFVLHFQNLGATILWTERKHIGNATQIEFVQAS